MMRERLKLGCSYARDCCASGLTRRYLHLPQERTNTGAIISKHGFSVSESSPEKCGISVICQFHIRPIKNIACRLQQSARLQVMKEYHWEGEKDSVLRKRRIVFVYGIKHEIVPFIKSSSTLVLHTTRLQ